MHDRRQLIEPGKIVSLDIGIWPWGATFNAGESLMLRVAGHNMCHPETERIRPKVNDMGNKGKHTVHTGGQYDSHIIIPVIN